MMVRGVSIGEMLNQSVTVLTKPSVETFERFERGGGQREATTYVAVAAAIAAVVALLFGLLGGLTSAIVGGVVAFLSPLITFFIVAFVFYQVGKSQGGTGTQDEVFYTVALYMAPIVAINGAIGAIPLLNCLALPVTLLLSLYGVYLGYLAARSSMNLDQNKAILTVVAAFVAQLIVGFIFGAVIAAVGIGTAAVNGTLGQ